jgi:hypothetical protein
MKELVCVIIFFLIFSLQSANSSFEPVQVICEVNGVMIPAIVDTGAEISVMSPSCAKKCKVSDFIDSQHAGRAIGVGSSEIIGGIDGLGIRIGPISFQNKISILNNNNHRCNFIIGLDILKRFDCDILLRERILKMYVRNNEIRIPLLDSHASVDNAASNDLNRHYQNAMKRLAFQSPRQSQEDEEEEEEIEEEEEQQQQQMKKPIQFPSNKWLHARGGHIATSSRSSYTRPPHPSHTVSRHHQSQVNHEEDDNEETDNNSNNNEYGEDYDNEYIQDSVSMAGV